MALPKSVVRSSSSRTGKPGCFVFLVFPLFAEDPWDLTEWPAVSSFAVCLTTYLDGLHIGGSLEFWVYQMSRLL